MRVSGGDLEFVEWGLEKFGPVFESSNPKDTGNPFSLNRFCAFKLDQTERSKGTPSSAAASSPASSAAQNLQKSVTFL